MSTLLTETKVNELLELLNPAQKNFLNQYIKQNKKSKWLETLAFKKGIVINEDMDIHEIEKEVDDWLLVEILDGGFGNRPYKCECGAALRYQYIVYHQSEEKTYELGVTCFENYTSLSPEILKDIKGGFHSIDLERDEILIKVEEQNFTDIKDFEHIEGIPEAILNQLKVGLPLTDNQLNKIAKIKEVFIQKRLNKETYEKLNIEQKELFDKLPDNHKKEILKKIQNRDYYNEYKIDELPEYIKTHIDAGLPLLNNHISLIYQIERQNKPSLVSKRLNKVFTPYTPIIRKPIPENITFDTLMIMHLSTFKAVREKEKTSGIQSESLRRDWMTIQQMVRDLKVGKSIDYPLLKLLLSNLIIPLRVERDEYL